MHRAVVGQTGRREAINMHIFLNGLNLLQMSCVDYLDVRPSLIPIRVLSPRACSICTLGVTRGLGDLRNQDELPRIW